MKIVYRYDYTLYFRLPQAQSLHTNVNLCIYKIPLHSSNEKDFCILWSISYKVLPKWTCWCRASSLRKFSNAASIWYALESICPSNRPTTLADWLMALPNPAINEVLCLKNVISDLVDWTKVNWCSRNPSWCCLWNISSGTAAATVLARFQYLH